MAQSRYRIFAALLGGAVLCTGAAYAAGILSDLVNPETFFAGFLGTWIHRDAGPSDIDRLMVTDTGSHRVRIQVFGRCENVNVVCNWGVQFARARMERPDSDAVRSITADFNLGYALRHLTLHKAPGGALSYDMVTEFTDGSDRHDYESYGWLLPPGAAAAAVTTAIPPGAMAQSPSASMIGSAQEDCLRFDAKTAYVARDEKSGWQIRDFLHSVVRFGPDRKAAFMAMNIVANYRFDEICFVGHGNGQMTYWRSAGEIARTPMAKQDCVEVHPSRVRTAQLGEDWKVVDGSREIYDYGDDQATANQAARTIRTYGLNRQCFFAGPDSTAHYWLAL